MIPKIIHYCWFGGNPLPDSAEKCIASWKKYFPNYEIKEWNETNFDIHLMPYVEEAYKLRKYAYVSDVARFWILYHNGGIYFDTDVEVIKSFDDILKYGAFMGQEKNIPTEKSVNVAPGLGLGVEIGHPFYKKVLEHYTCCKFLCDENGDPLQTVVPLTTKLLEEYGYQSTKAHSVQNISGINIYPVDYFCPLNYFTGKIDITNNTHSIHYYSASWMSKKLRLKMILKKKIGHNNIQKIKNILIRLNLRKSL